MDLAIFLLGKFVRISRNLNWFHSKEKRKKQQQHKNPIQFHIPQIAIIGSRSFLSLRRAKRIIFCVYAEIIFATKSMSLKPMLKESRFFFIKNKIVLCRAIRT